jgi:hypothetical protein
LPFVGNYSFELISQLNKEGHFVWMFDGFDEMKHGLTFEQFRYNFSQLLTLHSSRSKTIILGRPTAFLSDNERAFILQGRDRTTAGKEYRDPNWPEFKIFDIADWTPLQARHFLVKYFPIALKRSASTLNDEEVAVRLRSISEPEYVELAVRPVHARMLVEIAADPDESLDGATEHHLYDRFVHTILRRELAKKGRDKKIGIADRRRFAAEVAWWMWQHTGTRSARADQIPLQLVIKYNYDPNFYSSDSLRRELVAGCFVDKQDASTIYFSHRSFQEFLIAELLVTTDFLDYNVAAINSYYTPLISQFICHSVSYNQARLLLEKFSSYIGNLAPEFLKHLAMLNRKHNISVRREWWTNCWLTYLFLFSEFEGSRIDDTKADQLMEVSSNFTKEMTKSNQYAIAAYLHYVASKYPEMTSSAQMRFSKLILHIMMMATPIDHVLAGTYRSNGLLTRLLLAMRAEANVDMPERAFTFGIARFISGLLRLMGPAYNLQDLVVSEHIQGKVILDDLYQTYPLASALSSWRNFFSGTGFRGTQTLID